MTQITLSPAKQETSPQIKELSKKIETLFLSELLKVMFESTSLAKEKTTSTYMTAVIPEVAQMMAERDLGIGKFLTQNPAFFNNIAKNQKIELNPSQSTEQKIEKPSKLSLNLSSKFSSLPISGKITSSFGLRIDPIDGKVKHHNGVDIAVPTKTKIKPVSSGKVIYSGYSKGYGNCIIIEHDDGLQTVYAHNSKNLVKTGDTVSPDKTIALSGSTGRTTGPHLHFEVRKNGKPINPMAMINNLEKSSIS